MPSASAAPWWKILSIGFRAAGAALLSNVSYDRGEAARWDPDEMKLLD